MRRHLFAYGTLQHPRIIGRILNRIPPAASARLPGFARFRIRDEDFPGIIPAEDSNLDGTVFFDISDPEWERLDAYESNLYQRQTLWVTAAEGIRMQAETYVIPPQNENDLTRDPW